MSDVVLASVLTVVTVRRLHPAPGIVDDLDAAYRDDRVAAGRPWVMLNMIASLDGATALDGRSGGLGGRGDASVFAAVRAQADVILAGAQTVRAERYGPPSDTGAVKARREGAGSWPVARLAIVTNSLDLDLGGALFTESPTRTIVVTSEGSDRHARESVAAVADVIVTGGEQVDVAAALVALAGLGARVVLAEGGPRLNGQLVAHGLVDELCLTVAPVVVGGQAPRLAHGATVEPPTAMDLAHVLADDEGYLYLRYRRPVMLSTEEHR